MSIGHCESNVVISKVGFVETNVLCDAPAELYKISGQTAHCFMWMCLEHRTDLMMKSDLTIQLASESM